MVAGDVKDKSTGEKLLATALAKFGSADVLVNNAGILKPNLSSKWTKLTSTAF